MDEQATPVLTYRAEQSQSRRWAWFGAGAVSGALATSLAMLVAGRASRGIAMVAPATGTLGTVTAVPNSAAGQPPGVPGFLFPQGEGKLQLTGNGIGAPYRKFTFLAAGQDVVALRITCPSGRPQPIAYEWLHSTSGGADFTSPDVRRGTGSAVEKGGWGRVNAGPFSLHWSRGNLDGGWLYWPAGPTGVAVANETADDLSEFESVLASTTWQDKLGVTPDPRSVQPERQGPRRDRLEREALAAPATR